MIARGLFRNRGTETSARAAYMAAVALARSQVFYTAYAIPDTLDGRFEMIALHVFLLLYRLRDTGNESFGQGVFDAMFDDMDRALREAGTGDLSVGREVKRMAAALNGRITAYEAGLGGTDLDAAIRRNVFGTVPDAQPEQVAALSQYLRAQAAALAEQPLAGLLEGRPGFRPPAAP